MIILYKGTGSPDVYPVVRQATFADWADVRQRASRMLRARGYSSAEQLLDKFPFEIWEGTNSFEDEFPFLYLAVAPEQYVEYEALGGDPQYQLEFQRIAEALLEADSYVRFIAIGIEFGAELGAPRALTPSSKVSRVFLSHSSSDEQFVRRLAEDLRSRGHDIWLDAWKIKVGACIPSRIAEGLQAAQFVVVVMSARSCSSPWVDREWKVKYWDEVNSNQILVLPALIEDCDVPQLLKTKRYADFRSDYEAGLAQLLAAIEDSAPMMAAPLSSETRTAVALSLLAAAQSRQQPLSVILVDVVRQSQQLAASDLIDFARSEISGYETHAGPVALTEKTTEVAHRQIAGYLSIHQINPSFMGWSSGMGASLSYMQENTADFRPFTIIYPDPIVTVEAQLLKASSQKLLALELPASLFIGEPSTLKLNFYSAGDSFSRMYEHIRRELVKRLTRLALP